MQQIQRVFAGERFEIILVNDGSDDDSEMVCAQLVAASPDIITAVQLSRNFGEHNAVLAGLSYVRGDYVAVLDDDGQNPPDEIVRMLAELKRGNYDVVYGHYIKKNHWWFRNLGSRFNDRVATLMLGKPRDLYLSSFKVMNRFLIDEITKYRGRSICGWIDLSRYPPDWTDPSRTSHKHLTAIPLHISATRRPMAERVSKFLHRAAGHLGLDWSDYILFQHRSR